MDANIVSIAMRLLALTVTISTALAAKTWPVDGIVIAVDPPARTMLVAHRPIGNYMGAMAMPFRVDKIQALDGLYPGVHIWFDLVVDRNHSLATNVRKAGGADTPIPPPKEKLGIGDALPDFELTDQSGQTFRRKDLLGKVVAIDFIYTRCPLPDVCPRLAANFAVLQRHFRSRIGTDLLLISVTVDPDYDTPAVLAEYAKRWGADPRGWRFLTGDVSKIAPQLGEVYWTDEGSIGHNSTTSILDRKGKLAATVEGSSWRIDQVEQLIAHQLENAP